MNHSTMFDECTDHRSIQADTVHRLQQLSRLHFGSAAYFEDPTSIHLCLLFIDRALDYMLKAVYVQERGCQMAPPALTHHDVIQLTAEGTISELDIVTFVLNIHYLASSKDRWLLQSMHDEELRMIMNKVEEILIHLSDRLTMQHIEQG